MAYAVSLEGTGSVAEVAYDDAGGRRVVVPSPGPGWSLTFVAPPGSTVALRARASVAAGRLRVQVDARSPRLPPLVRAKDCAGTAVACDLEIPRETLP